MTGSSGLLQLARDVLEAQPFSGLLGAEVAECGDGAATLEIEVDGRHLQQYGLVHGGVWSYLADNVVTFAAGSVLGPNVVTSGVSVQYLRGAREGRLRARGTVVHHDDKHAVCTAELAVVGADGRATVCAIAQGTVFVTGGGKAGAR